MKKIIAVITVILSCSSIVAQTEFEALKYTQTEINGTARYMSMAGAFGALGGDASSIKDNPAGLGIYRRSEVAAGLNFTFQSTDSKWNNLNSSTSDPYKTKFNNFSFVISTPTWRQENGTSGLLNSNFSFTYNRLKNFDRNLNLKSGQSASSITDYISNFSNGYTVNDLNYQNDIGELFDNPNIATLSAYGYQGYLMDSLSSDGWISPINQNVTPAYKLTERGHLVEYSFGWAGNFNNTFYLGATVNIKSLDYTGISKYNEDFGSQGSMQLGDTTYTKGTGVSLNIGAIVRPTDYLRLGLSLQTPTVFSIDEEYYSTLLYNRTDINRGGTIVGNSDNKSYQLQSPMKINASVAYIIGTKALISAEYGYSFNSSMKYINNDGSYDYSYENEGMKDVANNSRTIKFGGEYKITDNFSLRMGYANANNSTKSSAEKFLSDYSKRVDTEYFLNNKTNYYTAGFGYREANWFLDFAYVHKVLNETFNPYRSSQLNAQTSADVTTSTNNLAVTLGLKF